MLYTISNGSLTAQVDSLGAQLVSLKGANGAELIWIGDPNYWKGQAPVLFPMVGALRAGKTLIGGQWYEMGQHGFARHMEFASVQVGADSLSLTLTSNAETKKMYPFDFAFTVTYALTESGYTTTFTVENTGTETMPFAVGGHPGFNIPVGEDAAFEDYTIVFEKPETQRCPAIVMGQGLIDPTGCVFTLENQREIPLKHSLFYQDALVFEQLDSHWVQVRNKKTGRGVTMDFTGFPMFGIWSAQNDGPYVCLEPWTGCATRTTEGDDFAEKHGMTLLPPGETSTHTFAVTIL